MKKFLLSLLLAFCCSIDFVKTAENITNRELILETAKKLLQQADILDTVYQQSVLDVYNKNLVGEPMSSENMRILAKNLLQELNNSALIIKNGSPIMLEVKEAKDVLNRYNDCSKKTFVQCFLKLDVRTAFLVADKLFLDVAFLIPLIKESIISHLKLLENIAETEKFDSVLQHVLQEYAMSSEKLIALIEKIKTDTDNSNDAKNLLEILLQTKCLKTIYANACYKNLVLAKKEHLLLAKKQAMQILEIIKKSEEFDKILLQHFSQEYAISKQKIIALIEKINTDIDTDSYDEKTLLEIKLQTERLTKICTKAFLLVQKELAPKRNLWEVVRTAFFDHKFKDMVPFAAVGAVVIGAAKVLVPAMAEAAL